MDVEVFRQQDRDWRRQLQGLSLVAEAGVDVTTAIDGLRTLATRVFPLTGQQRGQVLKRYAATLLVGLTGVASARYDEGTFWPRVEDVVEHGLPQQTQKLFSDTFRYGLDLLGLSRFDTPLRNLGEILMHAGIPVASVGDFIQVLQKRDSRDVDLTGTDFCAWASALTRATAATKGLDAPTWRFLTSGGDVSADLTDRFLEVLDAGLGADPASLPLESLPNHLAEEIRRLLTGREINRGSGRHRSRERRLTPKLVYVDGEVLLDLPPFEQRLASAITWHVTIAGESRLRRVAKPWPGDLPVLVREAVTKPAVEAVVAIPERDLEWTIPIVDTASPLLAFDARSGAALAAGSQLPKGRVWLAFPNVDDHQPDEALEVDGTIAIVEHVDAPYGWDTWSFALVDVSGATRIRPRSTDDFRWRYVSSITRPALEDVPTVPHIRASSGGFVLAQRPLVTLPPAHRDVEGDVASTAWTITVATADGEMLNSTRRESSPAPTWIDPWPEDAGTLVGDFQIRIVGPLGRGATFDVAIAEETTATTSTDFRWFSARDGLDTCRLEIDSSGHREVVDLDGATRRASVVVRDALGAPALTVTTDIDFMWASVVRGQSATKPGIGPAPLETESLSESVLRLNTVPQLPGKLDVVASGAVVQACVMNANATGIATLNLATISDTAERHGVVSLVYGAGERSTTIGLVRPRQLVNDIMVVDDELRVTKNGDSVPLELGVYLDFAPWREPVTVRIDEDTTAVPLPKCLQGRGPAVIATRVEDPWAADEWPALPQRSENTHHLDLPLGPAETLDDTFLAWVGNDVPLPSTPEALRFATEIYASLRHTRSSRPRWELFAGIGELSRALGESFLDAARSGSWSRTTHTRLLAEGWAATAPAAAKPLNRTTWTLSPFLGMLESFSGHAADEGDLLEHVRITLGEPALKILTDGVDPHGAVGAFRREAEIMSDFPKERIDELWRAAAPVPGALLNADQRLLHARELFDSRVSQRTREIATVSRVALRASHAVLQAELGERVRVPIGARSGGDGWPSLPCVSISLSLLARLAARGSTSAAESFARYRPRFAELAEAAPSFVEQDLVLAELWMTRWENE